MDDYNELETLEDSEEMVLITIFMIILATMKSLRRRAIPYNDLPFSGAIIQLQFWEGIHGNVSWYLEYLH